MKLNLPTLKHNHIEDSTNYSPRVKISTKKYEVWSKSVFAQKFSDSSYKNFIEYDDAVMFSDVHLRKNNERNM